MRRSVDRRQARRPVEPAADPFDRATDPGDAAASGPAPAATSGPEPAATSGPAAAPAATSEPAPAVTSGPEPAATSGPPVELDDAERATLLYLAREALAACTGAPVVPGSRVSMSRHAPTPALEEPAAAFVTLTIAGELRGCVGTIVADCPLWEAVVEAAVSAAQHDPRFYPVRASELPSIHLEISVLGRPAPLADPAAFRPGVDGVIVERGGRRGLLLPEVATEFGWGAVEMLDAVCRKAGLPGDAWRDPRTALFAFRTLRFGGPAVAAEGAPAAAGAAVEV